jgi:hydrogenase-4 component B
MLALTSGMGAACFVKAFGVTFLALPRSRYAEDAKESSFSMKAAMLFLAALTILFGLAAGFIMKLLASVAGAAMNINISNMRFSLNNLILRPQIANGAYISTPILAIVLAALGVIGFLVYRLFGRERTVIYKTWDCGYYKLNSRNEYTATAFSKPFRIAFSFFLLPYRKTQKIRESFYHIRSFAYETHTTPVFKKYIYDPALDLIFRSARYMRRIQPGSIHLYLAYIFCTVLLLIIFMHKF